MKDLAAIKSWPQKEYIWGLHMGADKQSFDLFWADVQAGRGFFCVGCGTTISSQHKATWTDHCKTAKHLKGSASGISTDNALRRNVSYSHGQKRSSEREADLQKIVVLLSGVVISRGVSYCRGPPQPRISSSGGHCQDGGRGWRHGQR